MDISGVVGGRVVSRKELTLRSLSISATGVIESAHVRPDVAKSIDGTGLIVAPGYVDLQINGGHGIDLLSTPEEMWSLGRQLPQHGVTGFLPTFITSRQHRTERAIKAIGQRPTNYIGAEPLGLHFEGPMLNVDKKGAHDARHIVLPEDAVVDQWLPEVGVALVTLAPEMPGASKVIMALSRRGIIVSAGHTMANAAEAHAGFDAGITMATHLFNAMAPFSHREPNLVGAVLANPNIVAGLIVDGIHVDPVAVSAAWNAKGPDGIALVTDAVAAMGLPPGEFNLGRSFVTSDANGVKRQDGTLAGSNLTMDQAVRNLVKFTGCTPAEALTCAATTPAAVLGRSGRGSLNQGSVADIVVLSPDLDVMMTITRGKLTYVAPGAETRLPA